MRIATIVGARPQFVKAAMISHELRRRRAAASGAPIEEFLVHTGQHFDREMSDVFFTQMELPEPDAHLGISGGSHGRMTGRMLETIEAVLLEQRPDWVVVHGDTNSTLAGALAAAKLGLPIAHVEAGLRSFNPRMPEEINRRLTDHASSLLFAPTDAAAANLRFEGIDGKRIVRTGDLMYDAMRLSRKAAAERDVHERLGLGPKGYVLATIHRAENTDDLERLRGVLAGLARLTDLAPAGADEVSIILPLHPRTRHALERHDMLDAVTSRIRLVAPVGYLDMLALERDALLVATDSGGVQKEAYFWGVPCITLRDETEWVELVEIGANRLVGADPERIAEGARAAIETAVPDKPLYGTGHAATEVLDELVARAPVTTVTTG
jgi:UDP-GlcNAc3NAcA epimerase